MAKRNYDEDYSWPGEVKSQTSKTKTSQAVRTRTAEPVSYTSSGKYRNPERNLTKEEGKDVAVAVASLVFSIIGLLTTIFLVGLGFSLAAFVMSIIVLKRKYYGAGFALTGLIISIVSLIASTVLSIILVVNIGDAMTEMMMSLLDGYVEDIGYQLEDMVYDQIYDYTEEFLGEKLDEYIERYDEYMEQNSEEEFYDEYYGDESYEEEPYEEEPVEEYTEVQSTEAENTGGENPGAENTGSENPGGENTNSESTEGQSDTVSTEAPVEETAQ